ncbi:MAG: hypothetical protein MRZ56_05875 [Sutterella sp.]|nr:hypothetical protein [Sutterella sp.]
MQILHRNLSRKHLAIALAMLISAPIHVHAQVVLSDLTDEDEEAIELATTYVRPDYVEIERFKGN